MKFGMKLIWVIILITALCILPMVNLVSAADQTQQSNKIFLSPFYTSAMTINTNYTFNVTVDPPDGVSSVKSAIINFDVWMSPTITFTLWVNGKSCNNPTYVISTTFASAGRGVATFDCSNIITSPGVYNVTMRPTQQGTGAATAWLDLTYMNNPGKRLQIFGTEYTVGDNGKIFIQLLENQITPINNATCYLTVYYPSGTKWYDKTIMTYQSTSNGLYYFDFTAPSTLGVYMTDVYCEYYTSTSSKGADNYVQATGWYVSGNGTSLTNIDSNYLITVEKNTNTGALTNVTTLLMAHLDEYTGTSTLDSSASPTTGTHVGPPTIGIPGQAGSAGVRYGAVPGDYTQFAAATKLNLGATEAYMMCFSFNESVSNTNGNRLISAEATDTIRFSFDGGNQIRFVSDRSGTGAQTVQSATSFVDSQWHTVCGFANFTTQTLYIDGAVAATAANIQSGTMTLSNGIFFGVRDGGGNDVVAEMDEVCYIKGTDANFASPSPQTLATNYNTNKQCGVPANTLDLNVTISGVTPYAGAYNFAIVTTYQWNELVETMNMYLWNYTGSSWYPLTNSLSTSLTDATVSTVLSNINISQFLSGGTMLIKLNDSMPTGATIGTLKLNQIRVDQTSYVQIPATQVRGGGEVHVTNIPRATTNLVNTETPGYVWSYLPNRNLTYYEDKTNYTKINNEVPQYVWNYTDRNLTYYADVTNYTLVGQSVWTSTATISAGLLNQIANAIWTRTDRNLTFYPPQVDMTNYTLIANTVWNNAIRNLTFYPDLTNYNLIQTMVWNATDRNLTYYPDMTDYNRIIIGVWNYTTRNLTFYPAQVDMTNYTLIIGETANAVWNATNRNLTFYPAQIDLTNYTQVADSVWNAASRNLTYTADVTNYNNIIVGVWNYTTRNLTFYPAQVDMTNYTRIDETILAVNQTLFDKITQSTTAILFQIDDVNNSLTAQILSVPTLVWTFNNRNLTYYQNFGDQTNYSEIANVVWNAAIRNLTFYPTQVDLTNYTLVADSVWTRTDRNLTFYADPTDYNKIFVGVWNNTDRNLTFYPAQIDMTNYTLIIGGTSQAVWNATDRNLTFYPTQVDLTNYTMVADAVWNAATRNLTYYQNFGDQTNYTEIVLGVWNATDRNLTFYPAQVDMTNYTAITENVVNGVWNATDRNLTFYPTQIDLTNYTQIAEVVWNAGSRNLTYTEDVVNYSQIVIGVWNAADRNLTFYPAQVDMTNYTKIAQDTSTAVWLYSDRNLTYYQNFGDQTNYTLIAETVWNNLNRTLTEFNFTVSVNETAISNAVWTAVDRTLTSFNFTVTADVNNTAIADAVWTAVNRTLTDYNQTDLTDYNKIQQMVWNATDRNLTYYQNFGDQTNYTLINEIVANNTVPINYTLIGDTVWQNLNRTLTDFNFTVNANINETAVANAVWQSVDRTLTSFNFTVNATTETNNTAIADAVWNAVNRTLTYYNQTDLTDYVKIQQMVWNATDRNLTYYQNFGDQTNYTYITEVVWNATTRTLTSLNITINSTEIAEAVWANSIRTLTDFSFTVNATVNNSAIAGAVWAYSNKTVDFATTGTTQNVTTVEDIANMGHTYVGGTEYIDGDNGKIAIRLVRGTGSLAEIETGANCSVSITYPNASYYIFNASMTELGEGAYTYNFLVPQTLGIYPYFTNCYVADRKYFSLDDFHVYANNYSSIAPDVWSYSTRNLTFYPDTNVSVNVTVQGNNLTANDVWTYPTRELTYYPTANLTLSNESIQELGNAVWQYSGPINANILTQFANAVSCTIQNLQTDLNLKPGVQINSC